LKVEELSWRYSGNNGFKYLGIATTYIGDSEIKTLILEIIKIRVVFRSVGGVRSNKGGDDVNSLDLFRSSVAPHAIAT
jgi:hypothetical protein